MLIYCYTLLQTVILLLLENGVMKTPKRRFLSLIFACLCISKALLNGNNSNNNNNNNNYSKLYLTRAD